MRALVALPDDILLLLLLLRLCLGSGSGLGIGSPTSRGGILWPVRGMTLVDMSREKVPGMRVGQRSAAIIPRLNAKLHYSRPRKLVSAGGALVRTITGVCGAKLFQLLSLEPPRLMRWSALDTHASACGALHAVDG